MHKVIEKQSAMLLDRVTITGADDSIQPGELIRLSKEFPFLEWGILVSENNFGIPRFPSKSWMFRLKEECRSVHDTIHLSLHLCGRWVRELLLGKVTFPEQLLDGYRRIQLNFHAERNEWDLVPFAARLAEMNRQIIFQIDGVRGNAHMERVIGISHIDVAPLFDTSGGAGIVPPNWPEPKYDGLYHGYAGGLGPDNLKEELPKIALAAGHHRIWIDMETKVRSDKNRQFDLGKVWSCANACTAWVTPWPAKEE